MGLAASHLPPSPLRGWVLGPPPCERLGRGPTLPGATPQEAGALGHVDAAFSGRHFPVLRPASSVPSALGSPDQAWMPKA